MRRLVGLKRVDSQIGAIVACAHPKEFRRRIFSKLGGASDKFAPLIPYVKNGCQKVEVTENRTPLKAGSNLHIPPVHTTPSTCFT